MTQTGDLFRDFRLNGFANRFPPLDLDDVRRLSRLHKEVYLKSLPGIRMAALPCAPFIGHGRKNGDSLKVEDLAKLCGLSYPWFAKKFREIYGISCKEYRGC